MLPTAPVPARLILRKRNATARPLGALPQAVARPSVTRNQARRFADVSWKPVEGADFYIVRYGTRPDLLTLSHQVYDGTHVKLAGLNMSPAYYFTVDAVNDSGITKGLHVGKAD